jgi:hypothetical protein
MKSKARRSPLIDYANCKECNQARDVRVLDKNGLCPMCLLVNVRVPENPWLPLPTYMEGR